MAIGKVQGIKRQGLVDALDLSLATVMRSIKALTNEPFSLVEYKGPRKTGGIYSHGKREKLL